LGSFLGDKKYPLISWIYDPIQGRKDKVKLGTKRQGETGEGTDFGAFPTFTVVTRLRLPNPKKKWTVLF
jgi:hypothetical protein